MKKSSSKSMKKYAMGGISGKGLVGNMKGKPDAKAAFVKLGNTKYASNKSSKKPNEK